MNFEKQSSFNQIDPKKKENYVANKELNNSRNNFKVDPKLKQFPGNKRDNKNKYKFLNKIDQIKEQNKEKFYSLLNGLKEQYNNLFSPAKNKEMPQKRKKVNSLIGKIKKVFKTGLAIAMVASPFLPGQAESGEITKKSAFSYLRSVENKVKTVDVPINIESKLEKGYFSVEDVEECAKEAVKLGIKQYRGWAKEVGVNIDIPTIDIRIASNLELDNGQEAKIPDHTVGAYWPEYKAIVINPRYAKILQDNPAENPADANSITAAVFAAIVHETVHAVDYNQYPEMQTNEIICHKWSRIEDLSNNLEYLPENMQEVDARIKSKMRFTKYTEKNAMTIQIRFFKKLLQSADIELEKCNKKLQTNLSNQERKKILQQKNTYQDNVAFLTSAIKQTQGQFKEVIEGSYTNMTQGNNQLRNQMREILNLKAELNK